MVVNKLNLINNGDNTDNKICPDLCPTCSSHLTRPDQHVHGPAIPSQNVDVYSLHELSINVNDNF